MARSSSGTHNEPQYSGTSAPAIAANLTEVASYAALVGNRKVDLSSVRTALTGADRWVGLEFFETDTSILYLYLSTGWKPWESDWISYTPVLGTNITLGSGGTIVGKYQWVAGRPTMKAEVTFGTGGTIGGAANGNSITLPPVTLAALRHQYQEFKGNVIFHDVSAQVNFTGGLFADGSSTTQARIVYQSGGETNLSSTVPFGAAFAVGDFIEIDVRLEVA